MAMASFGAELIMVREAGCPWCAQWDREIAPIYPRTPESRSAPLRNVYLHASDAAGVEFQGAVTFTPTFVLVESGREVGRIEGYPGEDFFWALLAELLGRLTKSGKEPDS